MDYELIDLSKTTEGLIQVLNGSNQANVHVYVTNKLKNKKIENYIPYIVDIMLKHNSDPIYELLKYKSWKYVNFRITLFFYLRSCLTRIKNVTLTSKCFYLCCDLQEIDLLKKRRAKSKFRVVKHFDPKLKSIKREISQKDKKFIKNSVKDKKLIKEEKHIKNSIEKSVKDENLIKNPIENSIKNTVVNFVKRRNGRDHFSRLKKPIFKRFKVPSLQGLILSFSRAVINSVVKDLDFKKRMNKLILPHFTLKRNIRNISKIKVLKDFGSNLIFYQKLIDVCNDLLEIPNFLKERFLTVKLELLNLNLKNEKIFDLLTGERIVFIHTNSSSPMTSKENAPYLINIITQKNTLNFGKIPLNNEYYNHQKISSVEIDKVNSLMVQFNVVKDLDDIGDLNGIRLNIIEAVEQILFKKYKSKSKSKSKSIKNPNLKSNIFTTEEGNLFTTEEGNPFTTEEGNPFTTEEDLLFDIKNKILNLNIYERCSKSILHIKTLNENYNTEIKNNELNNSGFINNDNCFNNSIYEDSSIHFKNIIETDEGNIDLLNNSLIDEHYYEDRMNWHFNNYKFVYDDNYNRGNIKYPSYYNQLTSIICKNENYNISSYIVKNGSDMSEEYQAFKIISQVKSIFKSCSLPIYLKNYKIFIISDTCGLVETIKDTKSIHKVKLQSGTLMKYFENNFIDLKIAKNNFLYSLVGYSLIQYLLLLKDRHNNNLLLDDFGHIVHVDFGFILGKHPGIYGVEMAPFKFSSEYLDLIDIEEFKLLFKEGFKCLSQYRHLIPEVCERLDTNGLSLDEFTDYLISKSVGNYSSVIYDQIQYIQNGYY